MLTFVDVLLGCLVSAIIGLGIGFGYGSWYERRRVQNWLGRTK